MNVSRSGYYKWKNNKGNLKQYQLNRIDLERLVNEIHSKNHHMVIEE